MLGGLGLGIETDAFYVPHSAGPPFKASILADYNPAAGISLSGANVTALADQSGTGDANKNLTAGASQPTYTASDPQYNGLPTIQFASATAQILTSGAWSVAPTQPITLFAVGHVATNAGSPQVFVSSPAGNWELYDAFGLSTHIYSGTDLRASITTLNTPSIIIGQFNGASSTLAVRQDTPQGSGAAGAGAFTSISLGNRPASSFALAGTLARVIVYSGLPTVHTITSYLATRYGLTQGP